MSEFISSDEIRSALNRSGYLLESRIGELLRKRDFRVVLSHPYPDPETGKSREIDVYAKYMRSYDFGPSDDDFLWPELLIECVNPPQPMAFIGTTPTKDFLAERYPLQYLRILGRPIHVPDSHLETNWFWLASQFGLGDRHHYARGRLCTQFCSFEKKRGSDEWMAFHRDTDHLTLRSLCNALEHMTAAFYSSSDDPYSDYDLIQLALLHPVLVVQGPLVEVLPSGSSFRVRSADHLKFIVSLARGGAVHDYLIDVVTEKFFPRYLTLIAREARILAGAMKERKADVRALLALHHQHHLESIAGGGSPGTAA